ncbi:hypothetical protein GMOD_00002584 [Pyrenophora seminiperda CCB06]|uniref:Uncharacterized protein n=1 Tax=Pyrenophora seminiperda CCB06 TaxID=1302712 RepID=A0A3M7M2Y5_9PLEO|nr:hypothetical protein GMOD_00002584 [Pyrenophora seminiperda CCB06]
MHVKEKKSDCVVSK